MPQTPLTSESPNAKARIESGRPRPTTTGSVSRTPMSERLRIRGSGLISLFNGMKPETTAPDATATGNARAAMVSAADMRSSARSASRRASAALRRSDLAEAIREAVTSRLCPADFMAARLASRPVWTTPDVGSQREAKSAEPRWPQELRSRVPYESRWAPYVRAHEPGQGQLPSGSIRPRGYDSKRTPQPRLINVMGSLVLRHATAALCAACQSAQRHPAVADRLIEPPGEA